MATTLDGDDPPAARLTIECRGGVDVTHLWERFTARHADWLGRVATSGPLQALTAAIIDRLEQPHRGRVPFLDPSAAAAERALLQACREAKAVGFWEGVPLRYDLLTPPPAPLSDAELKDLRWSRRQRGGYREARVRMECARARLKGYPGWLLTEPAYLEQEGDLERRWDALPAGRRPTFPLRRTLRFGEVLDGAVPAPADLGDFAQEVNRFLDRWGLTALATWQLPDPQGPMLPALLPPNSPALPRHGIHLILPVHYPLNGDEEIPRLILELQRGRAEELGLAPSVAGLPHHAAYGQIFELIHYEGAVRTRYGASRPPRGLIGALEESLAESMQISVSHVQRLRKAITQCRQGRRDRVGFLRVRGRIA